ncbi:MAG: hypothetical protein L3J10_10375 [Sulfurimonas sp.]|nr:hypothetical protein [Sulfurimonas sp.]
MFKLISFIFIFSSIFFIPLNAKSSFNGQKVYLKECRICHKGSDIFLDKYTVPQWKNFLNKDSTTLANIHLNKKKYYVASKDDVVKDSHSFFKSKNYKDEYKVLENFIIKHVEKSGIIFYNH